MRNRITEITLLFVMVLGLIGCGKSLSGLYISESGSYAVEFENDGTCTWYQGETFFEGTYKAKDKGYILEIRGNGLYSNTVFTAVKDNGDLIINGGTVNHERFSTKKSNNLSDETPNIQQNDMSTNNSSTATYDYLNENHVSSSDNTDQLVGVAYAPANGSCDSEEVTIARDIVFNRIQYYSKNGTVNIDGSNLLVEIPIIVDAQNILESVAKTGGLKAISKYSKNGDCNYQMDPNTFLYDIQRNINDMYSDGSVLFDEKNITDIRIIEEYDIYGLELNLDSQGSSALQNYIAENSNDKGIAIIYSGNIISEQSIIDMNMSSLNLYTITCFSSQEEAEEAKMYIQSGSLPYELSEIESYVR